LIISPSTYRFHFQLFFIHSFAALQAARRFFAFLTPEPLFDSLPIHFVASRDVEAFIFYARQIARACLISPFSADARHAACRASIFASLIEYRCLLISAKTGFSRRRESSSFIDFRFFSPCRQDFAPACCLQWLPRANELL